MSSFSALNAAIYSKLAGGTALTSLLSGGTAVPSIYYLQAPDSAALDYAVFSYQGGGDENWTAHRTKNLMLFVRGYSKTGPAQAGSIDAQIDALLHGIALTVSGWANFWTAREEDISLVDTDPSGKHVWMAGGMYRLRIEKS